MSSWRALALAAVVFAAASELRAEGWQPISERDGLAIEARRDPDGGRWLRARRVLAARPASVRDELLDLPRFPTWFPDLTAFDVIAREGADTLVYGRHDLPWPMRDRDYVVRYRSATSLSGRFELTARSADDTYRPPTPEAVRLGRVHSRFEVEPADPDGADVSYAVLQTDGRLPRFLAERRFRTKAARALVGLEARAAERDSGRP